MSVESDSWLFGPRTDGFTSSVTFSDRLIIRDWLPSLESLDYALQTVSSDLIERVLEELRRQSGDNKYIFSNDQVLFIEDYSFLIARNQWDAEWLIVSDGVRIVSSYTAWIT